MRLPLIAASGVTTGGALAAVSALAVGFGVGLARRGETGGWWLAGVALVGALAAGATGYPEVPLFAVGMLLLFEAFRLGEERRSVSRICGVAGVALAMAAIFIVNDGS